MHEVVEEQEIRHLEEGIPLKNISMFFKRNSSNDPRRYNIPKIGEIAVIFDGENGEPHMEDFMIQPKVRNNEFITTKLSYLSQNADPNGCQLKFGTKMKPKPRPQINFKVN